jgi:hypothetical protein
MSCWYKGFYRKLVTTWRLTVRIIHAFFLGSTILAPPTYHKYHAGMQVRLEEKDAPSSSHALILKSWTVTCHVSYICRYPTWNLNKNGCKFVECIYDVPGICRPWRCSCQSKMLPWYREHSACMFHQVVCLREHSVVGHAGSYPTLRWHLVSISFGAILGCIWCPTCLFPRLIGILGVFQHPSHPKRCSVALANPSRPLSLGNS